MKHLTALTGLIAVAAIVLLVSTVASADEQTQAPSLKSSTKMQIGARPVGRIAFVGDSGVYIMDTDGKNRQKICAVTNAKGRLSFSPDNKIVAFSREGMDASKLPSDEGGKHLLHDVFLAYLDSASTRTSWWRRVTFSLGGHQPEWSTNDSIVYFQNDIHANEVDYIVPSHQLAMVNVDDGHTVNLRKDWQTLNTWMLSPSLTRDGRKVAFVISYSDDAAKYMFKTRGIKVLNMANIMVPEEELRKPSPGLENTIAPSWSPDGQWLAYITNDMRNPGLFIIKPDLTGKRQVFASSVSQQVNADPVGWSPDSKWVTFAAADGTIYIIDINGERLMPLTGAGKNSNPTWSR